MHSEDLYQDWVSAVRRSEDRDKRVRELKAQLANADDELDQLRIRAEAAESEYGRTLNALRDKAHAAAKANGWWEGRRTLPELLCLVHSEVSEALEEHRAGMAPYQTYYVGDSKKPEGVPSELADVVIRVLDICGRWDIDIEGMVDEKLAYNATRGYKHGGKTL